MKQFIQLSIAGLIALGAAACSAPVGTSSDVETAAVATHGRTAIMGGVSPGGSGPSGPSGPSSPTGPSGGGSPDSLSCTATTAYDCGLFDAYVQTLSGTPGVVWRQAFANYHSLGITDADLFCGTTTVLDIDEIDFAGLRPSSDTPAIESVQESLAISPNGVAVQAQFLLNQCYGSAGTVDAFIADPTSCNARCEPT